MHLVELIKTETDIFAQRIGFGTPGALEPSTQTMKNCNTTSLYGRPLKADLEKALGVDVVIANDANVLH